MAEVDTVDGVAIADIDTINGVAADDIEISSRVPPAPAGQRRRMETLLLVLVCGFSRIPSLHLLLYLRPKAAPAPTANGR